MATYTLAQLIARFKAKTPGRTLPDPPEKQVTSDEFVSLGNGLETLAAGPAADSIAEAQLAPAVRTKLNAAGEGTAPAAGIDYANPVLVTTTTTLQANKSHLVSGAGYPLTLPDPAASAGQQLFVRIHPQATGMYTVGAGQYHNDENVLLLALGGSWVLLSVNYVPLSAQLRSDTSQLIIENTNTSLIFATVLNDNSGGVLRAGPPNTLRVARACTGVAQVDFFAYANAGAAIELGLTIGGQTYKQQAVPVAGTATTLVSQTLRFQMGDLISAKVYGYTGGPAGTQLGSTIGDGIFLKFTENMQ